MNNKILVKLLVPEIDESYDVYIPVGRKIGNVIVLLGKTVNELSNGVFEVSEFNSLYDSNTGNRYQVNDLVLNTNIRNGSSLVLLS